MVSRLLNFSVKWQTGVPYHVGVAAALATFLHHFDVLVKTLTLLLFTDISQIVWEVIKETVQTVNLQALIKHLIFLNLFNMLTSIETYCGSFSFPKNLVTTFLNDTHASFSLKVFVDSKLTSNIIFLMIDSTKAVDVAPNIYPDDQV